MFGNILKDLLQTTKSRTLNKYKILKMDWNTLSIITMIESDVEINFQSTLASFTLSAFAKRDAFQDNHIHKIHTPKFRPYLRFHDPLF